jgi:lipopolysaccharide biosynthesis regulator YciM
MLAVVVGGSLLAIGTVHFFPLIAVAIMTFATAVETLRRTKAWQTPVVVPLPALVCVALAAYTLIQACPLPIAWLRAVAPSTADVWDRCLLPFASPGPSWATLSLDPGASVVEALKLGIYGAVFTVASTLSSRRDASLGIATVFFSAGVGALTTLVHGLAGATAIYGLYEPQFGVVPWHVGPLLNGNNLAGYLNLGALCGMGLLIMHRPILPRWSLGLGVALIIGVDVTAASRGGVLALPVAIITLGALTWRPSRDSQEHRANTGAWLVVAALAGGCVLAMLGGTYQTWAELYDKNLAKLEMIVWARPMIFDHPLFGIGRGAFESVFPQYRLTPGNVVYTHAENFPAQWIAEWGLPVGIAALATFGWAFAPQRLGVRRSALAAGAWAGVAALLLQNMVDLALEVPAVCIALATVLGAVWGDAGRHRPREGARASGPVSNRGVAVGVAGLSVGFACLIAGAFVMGQHDVASDRNALRGEYEKAGTLTAESVGKIRDEIRRTILRHPAEPYFPLVGATLAARTRDTSAIPWLERTLERGPVNGRAHLLLAGVLSGRGATRQALLELRFAVHDDPGLVWEVASLAVRYSKTFEDLLIAVPEGAEGAGLLDIVAAQLTAPSQADLQERCDHEAILRNPRAVGPRLREANLRLAAMAKGSTSSLCADRARCRAEVADLADTIFSIQPELSTAPVLRARLLAVDDKPVEATQMLSQVCDDVADRINCLQARAAMAAEVKGPEPFASSAKDLLGAACTTPPACADMATWLATLRAQRGEQGAALVLYGRAAREDPTNETRWLRLADAASRGGAHAQAAEALETAARQRGGADTELRRRIEQERAQAMSELLTAPHR